MALVPDQKFSTFQNGGDVQVGDTIVGLRGGINTKFNYTGDLPPTYIVPITQGGTGATTAAGARTNLGLGTMAVQNANAVAITGGSALLTSGQVAAVPTNPNDLVNKSYVDGTLIPLGAAGTIIQSNGTNWIASTPTYPTAAGSAGQIFRSDGTNFALTTATYPATTTINQLLFSSATNTITGITAATGGVLVSSNTQVPSWLANPTATGRVLTSVSGAAPAWSTATFPSTAGAAGTVLQSDGTNWIASTPTYPTTAGSAGQIFRSNGTNFALTTATFPTTTTANQLLYSSAANTVGGLATANNGILVTSGAGVPSIGNAILADITVNGHTVGRGGTAVATNLALGLDALLDNTTGVQCTAVGYQALQNNTTANNNTAVGYLALSTATTNGSNTAVGHSALRDATSIAQTAIGYFALAQCTSGTLNQATGFTSLTALTTGTGNTAGGHLSMATATTGNQNTAFGYSALTTQTTSSNNSAFGYAALLNIATASNATAVGFSSLISATGGLNTAIGASTGGTVGGGTALTTGTNNVFLGYGATSNAADSVGTLAVGYAAVANKATGATSADDGPGIAIGSTSARVGFRGDGTIYPTSGASAGFWLVKINGTEYKIQLFAK